MDATRFLIVLADDYGIGPETSRGILELAARGVVTGTVLMVNSPHAPEALARLAAGGGADGTGLAPLPDPGPAGRRARTTCPAWSVPTAACGRWASS